MSNFRTVPEVTSTSHTKLENADKIAALLKTSYSGPEEALKFLLETGADFSALIVRDGIFSGYTA
jgi:hypothetical protein